MWADIASKVPPAKCPSLDDVFSEHDEKKDISSNKFDISHLPIRKVIKPLDYLPNNVMPLRKPPQNKKIMILDAGCFIKLKKFDAFLFTTPSVLGEVRDEQTRFQLENGFFGIGPLKIEVGEKCDYNFVNAIAKKTGDIGSLSKQDIDLAALAVKLTRQFKGKDYLRDDLTETKLQKGSNKELMVQYTQLSKKKMNAKKVQETKVSENKKDVGNMFLSSESRESLSFSDVEEEIDYCEDGSNILSSSPISYEDTTEGYYSDDESEESSSDNAWINESNLHEFDAQHHQRFQPVNKKTDNDIILQQSSQKQLLPEQEVSCVTTDKSLMNCLTAMNVSLTTIDGIRIQSVMIWGYLCRACKAFNSDTQLLFCKDCGSDMIRKVPYERRNDGSIQITDTRWFIKSRGYIYDTPKPKAGKAGKYKVQVIDDPGQLLDPSVQWRLRKEKKDHMTQLNNAISDVTNGYISNGYISKATNKTATQFIRVGGNRNSKKYHARMKNK